MEKFLLNVVLPALIKYLQENPQVLSNLIDLLFKQIVAAIEKAVADAQAK